MNYKIWYDEECEAVYLQIINMLNADDVNAMMPGINEALGDRNPRLVVVDLASNPPGFLEGPARKAFRSFAREFDFYRIAMFGPNHAYGCSPRRQSLPWVNPILRNSSRVKKDALEWLKGGI